jgi:DNA polymerase II small subunit/DNA polymerase delta subunit B
VHPALQLQPTEESNSPDIRRNSTSSESSTNENVEQTKRPILFRYDNVDVSMNRGNSIKKIVRIHEPVSSDSSETEYSSEAGLLIALGNP